MTQIITLLHPGDLTTSGFIAGILVMWLVGFVFFVLPVAAIVYKLSNRPKR